MYEFLIGPMLWISIIVCACGLTFKTIRLIVISHNKLQKQNFNIKPSDKNKIVVNYTLLDKLCISAKRSIIGTQPMLFLLTVVFHVVLLLTPFFVLGHNILFSQSWDFSFLSLPERLTDILTVILMLCASVYFMRRIAMSNVRAVTTIYDYILLLITIAPFVTGFLAYHQIFDYENIMIVHIISGEIMLAAIGITKLGHMVLFFFSRFFIASEYSFKPGSRTF